MTARSFVSFAAILLLSTGFAHAQSAAEVIDRWGLIGTWAVDCTRPPSVENGYSSYLEIEGRAVHERAFGTYQDSNPILQALVAVDGSIQLTIDFSSLSQVREFALTKGSDGRVRAVFNRRAGSEEYTVRNGKLIHNGQPTNWQSRCR